MINKDVMDRVDADLNAGKSITDIIADLETETRCCVACPLGQDSFAKAHPE